MRYWSRAMLARTRATSVRRLRRPAPRVPARRRTPDAPIRSRRGRSGRWPDRSARRRSVDRTGEPPLQGLQRVFHQGPRLASLAQVVQHDCQPLLGQGDRQRVAFRVAPACREDGAKRVPSLGPVAFLEKNSARLSRAASVFGSSRPDTCRRRARHSGPPGRARRAGPLIPTLSRTPITRSNASADWADSAP